MICRGIVGQVIDESFDVEIDWVEIEWPQTLRRALRLTSQADVKVDVLLPPGARLAEGSVLSMGPPILAVRLAVIDVIAIHFSDPVVGARLAYDLGNRHLPAQIVDAAILTPDDGPARAVAASNMLPFTTERVRFYPEPVTLDGLFRG